VVTDIILRSPLEQLRGVIGRYPGPDERYIFEFDRARTRSVHMVAVTKPLLVSFQADGHLVKTCVLDPWTGSASARCDRIVEQPPPEITVK